jgi:hypothetical protein
LKKRKEGKAYKAMPFRIPIARKVEEHAEENNNNNETKENSIIRQFLLLFFSRMIKNGLKKIIIIKGIMILHMIDHTIILMRKDR